MPWNFTKRNPRAFAQHTLIFFYFFRTNWSEFWPGAVQLITFIARIRMAISCMPLSKAEKDQLSEVNTTQISTQWIQSLHNANKGYYTVF